MKTARIHAVALVVGCSFLGTLAITRPAAAQCIPDPPTGSMTTGSDNTIIVRNCGEFAARPTPRQPVATVAGVPLTVFIRNPLASTVSWMASRSLTDMTGRVALKPRGGWTTKRVGW